MQSRRSICQYFTDSTKHWWYGYRLNKYPGSKWDKPLGDDEIGVLYHFFREVSFVRDFVGKYVSQKIERSIREGP